MTRSTQTSAIDALQYGETTGKRAVYEEFSFHPRDGAVQADNESHEDADDHSYTVDVQDGVPVSCSCPADKWHDGACKHRVAVALAEPVLEAAGSRGVVA